ncbi:MAG: glycosyltransferase family 4 protein [Candidatus Omnitrophica bacterium]|nr:glycosyltransferase family 4 protein [Candidatus Omnitrophota bacterium]
MKIVLVVHTAYPEFIGGREHHVHHLASILSKNDTVVVIAGGRGKGKQKRIVDGYTLITLPMISITVSHNPLQIYRIIPKLYSCLSNEKPDIVHAFEYGSFSTNIVHFYTKKCNIPFVVTIYGYQFTNVLLKFLKILYDRFIGKRLLLDAHKILCPSDTQRKEIININNKNSFKNKIILQENCIPVDKYKDIAINEELLKLYNITIRNKVTLLTATRLLPRKGIKYLLFALDTIKREYQLKNIQLLLAGPDCGELSNIKKIIKKLDLGNNVSILGSIPFQNMKYFMFICDIFVLPSLYEGLPLSLLEAMAARKSVISTDLPCARKIITHLENGFLVKPGDVDSLVRAVITLSADKNMRINLGRKAQESVKQLDSYAEAKKLREIYASILQ